MQATQDFIKAIVVYNPLDLTKSDYAELEYAENKPLSRYLDGLPENVNWAVTIDGLMIDHRAADLIIPTPNSTIVVVPEIEGGEGGAGAALAIVATVALSVFAPMAGGAIASAMGYSSTGVVAAIAAAGVSIAGGLLISALTPVAETPELEAQSEKSSFGIDGAKNTSTENIPVPVIYGEHAFGGNYIDLYTENTTDANGADTQYVYGRIAISEGPIDSVFDLKINDQPIENFENVTVDYRLGTDNQNVSEWFDKTITMFNDGRTVKKDSNVIYSTSQEVDKLRADIVFPAGLYRNRTSDVGIKDQAVRISIRWRETGSTEWLYLSYDADGAPIGVTDDTVSIIIEDTSSKAVRRSFFTPKLTEGFYDIQVIRVTDDRELTTQQDEFILSDVGEIILDTTALPNTAWVAFRAMLSDDITGIPKFTGSARGRVLDIYDHEGNVTDTRWSNNPRDVELDMMLNTRYGASASKETIDFAARAEWAEFCDEAGLTFDGVFDTLSNIEDETRHVYIAGRAERVSSGARSSVVFDAPSEPVMLFGDGNMVDGSFNLTYIGTDERVNDIEIQFFDKESEYQQRSARQVDEYSIARGQAVKSSSVFRKGVTNIERADREAVLLMNKNHLIRRTAKWRAPIEALHCAAGDVVRVQRSEVDWSEGGRILEASVDAGVTRFKLDHPVKVRSDRNYSIVVHMNAVALGSYAVTSKAGNLVTVDGVIDKASKLRFAINGEDYGVSRVIEGGSTTDLLLETRAQGANLVGLTGTLHRTDEMVTYSVDPVVETLTTDEIFVSEAVEPPHTYANFIFGRNAEVERLFRITKIEFDGAEFDIEAQEYNADVYNDTPVTPSVKSYGSARTFNNVLNLEAEEILTKVAGGYRSTARVTWDAPATGEYINAIVQMSKNGNRYRRIGRFIDECEVELKVGDVVSFRVLARTTDGVVAAKNAPTVTLTAQGFHYRPDAPTNWSAKTGPRTVTLVMSGSFEDYDDGIALYRFYGAATDDFSTASLLGEGRVTSFLANPDANVDLQHYWVTAVSLEGKESDPSATISATPGLLDYGDLSPEITDKLNSIDEVFTSVDDFIAENASKISTISDAQDAADVVIQEAQDSINSIDGRVTETQSKVDDLESRANSADGTIASIEEKNIDLSLSVDGLSADLLSEQILRVAGDVVNSAHRVGTTASTDEGFAAVDQQFLSVTDSISSLSNFQQTAEATFGDTTAIFNEEITSFADAVSALSESTRSLETTLGDTSAIFNEEITTFSDAVSSVSTQYSELVATYGSTETAEMWANAAATSASEAAVIKSDTDIVASAVRDDRLLAETARNQAETYRTEAVTAKESAETSESNAATSAGIAATSANTAGEKADAAAQHASVASTKATDAETKADAAETARIAAETAKSRAETAETNAASSESNAAGSASTAATYATLASNSANDAGNSASAASSSASLAATKADDASQYSISADEARNEATTAKNSAYTYSQESAQSATNAAGSASAAERSAKVATQSIGSEAFRNATFQELSGGFPIGVNRQAASSGKSATYVTNANAPYGGYILLQNNNTSGSHLEPYVYINNSTSDGLVVPTDGKATKGLRVTIEIAKEAGNWAGAHARVSWIGSVSGGTDKWVNYFFHDYLSGENNVVQTLEFDCYQPEGVTGSTVSLRVHVFGNSNLNGTMRTLRAQIHKISVKPLTETASSFITQKAVEDIKGNLASSLVLGVTAGNKGSLLELKAADGSAGSYSLAQISADDIILDGTISEAKFANTIKSDNFSPGSAGWRIRRDGSAEFNGPVISRSMLINSGQFTYSGTLSAGDIIPFINSGIRMGKNEVWNAFEETYVMHAAVVTGMTAPGGFDPLNTFWGIETNVSNGGRWWGYNEAAPNAEWNKDPSTLVTMNGATGTSQRMFFNARFVARGGAYAINPVIRWRVLKVT